MSTLSCAACEHIGVTVRTITCTAADRSHGKTFDFIFCDRCGYVRNPGNTHDYHEESAFDAVDPTSPRVGDGRKPGREYRMMQMGVDILRIHRGDFRPEVAVLGAGMSKDHALILEKLPVSRAAVSDLENFQSSKDFVPMSSRQPEFDVVVACEVIEHFVDLIEDFTNLLSKVRNDGLAIASTNMHDGVPLARLAYPFDVGHTSYYSGRSLREICKRLDGSIHLDFRTPSIAFRGAGPRKRYIYFYRDMAVGDSIAQYFADNHVAPSE